MKPLFVCPYCERVIVAVIEGGVRLSNAHHDTRILYAPYRLLIGTCPNRHCNKVYRWRFPDNLFPQVLDKAKNAA